MKEKELKNLGMANSWFRTPKELKECQSKGHTPRWSKTDMRCVTKFWCPKCGYYYLVDSSD